MDIDKTTLTDLSIFNTEEEFSVFSKLDFTRTVGGREKLKQMFSSSLKGTEEIVATQQVLKLIIAKEDEWPMSISNGSIMMIYKFFESALDPPPSRPSPVSAYLYKVFHGPDFSLVKYSAHHVFDFLKGMKQILSVLSGDSTPVLLRQLLGRAQSLMDKPQLDVIDHRNRNQELSRVETLRLAYFVRYQYKRSIYELLEIYGQLDAWYGMAMSVQELGLTFPEFVDSEEPLLQVDGLYHLLLKDPVGYDVELGKRHNFIFLTGANMAGKSTFIKAVGIAIFLAHKGMGVPAAKMHLSLFDGLLSNINVQDNVVKGESYFYNEVQRIKNTVLKVNDGRKWLILIDELFKGTNMEDAMKCSAAVIKGLLKIKRSLFILSTHLYEISEEVKGFGNIDFKYFETQLAGEELLFSYKLREGVSNDRLGYFILQQEKVIDLLDSL